MPFIGEVTVNIIFGTKYDDVNVPYYTADITRNAEKVITLTGQVVWQSTFIYELTVNVQDYQDIVGAQYASILDTGTESNGLHWFVVLGYQNISKKSVLLSLKYDPLLSIGIGNISKISGTLLRWSVSNDAPFRYTMSPEPIDQIDDFDYTYFRKQCDVVGPMIQILGNPYNLKKPPKILEYVNEDGTNTNIFYPQLTSDTAKTTFTTSVGGDKSFFDNFKYYLASDADVIKNLNYAVGLGYDIVTNTYAIPDTSLISIFQSDNFITLLKGNTEQIETGMTLTNGGFNNQKATETGIVFSLYNEITGDCVSINNYDLGNTQLTLSANPYINGYLAARFSTYNHDTEGFSGLVKSAGYAPVNFTASVGSGTSAARLNNAMQIDTLLQSSTSSVGAQEIAMENMLSEHGIAYRNANWEYDRTMISGGVNFVGDVLSLNVGGAIKSAANAELQGRSIRNSMDLMSQQYQNANTAAQWSLDRMNNERNMRMRQLTANGTLGQLAPPPVKFSNDFNVAGAAYTFVVRRASLSNFDRKRADNFFTAFGYNVNHEVLNDPTQLWTRTRFTFVQADNVEIEQLTLTDKLIRIRDTGTVQEIKQRFASGLRIWHVAPDFDWSKPNPSRNVTIPGLLSETEDQ